MYKAIPVEDYYIIVSNEPCENFGSEWDGKKIIAQSKPTHEGIPLFDAPWEVDVDYERAVKSLKDKWNIAEIEKEHYEVYAQGKMYLFGFSDALETHKWTDEDMINLIQSLKDYTRESHCILGHDEREAKELFDTHLQSLKKPKVYEVQLEMDKFEVDMGLGDECIEYCEKPKITNNKATIKNYKQC